MLYSVQYLRGLAALLVVVSHCLHKLEQLSGYKANWLTVGGSGVDLFFVISGFIMCMTTYDKKTSPASFMKARLIRIVPLYWILSGLALLVYLWNPALVNSSGGVTTIVHSFSLIPVGDKLLIQNGWTLSYEFWFYIIFSISLFFGHRLHVLVCTSLLLLIATAGFFFVSDVVLYRFATNSLLLEFLFGMMAYLYLRKYARRRFTNGALALFGFSIILYANYASVPVNRIVYFGIPYALIIVGAVTFEGYMHARSDSPVMKFLKALGDSSYSLYLLHPFALSAVAILISIFSFQMHIELAFFSMLSIALISGYICYIALEKPIAAFFKKKVRISTAVRSA